MRSFSSNPFCSASSFTVSSSFINARPSALDLVGIERALIHPPQRLPLQQLPDELDQREHELHHRSADVFRVGVPAARRGLPLFVETLAKLLGDQLQLFEVVSHAKAYGGEGPVITTCTRCRSAARVMAARYASARPRSIR